VHTEDPEEVYNEAIAAPIEFPPNLAVRWSCCGDGCESTDSVPKFAMLERSQIATFTSFEEADDAEREARWNMSREERLEILEAPPAPILEHAYSATKISRRFTPSLFVNGLAGRRVRRRDSRLSSIHGRHRFLDSDVSAKRGKGCSGSQGVRLRLAGTQGGVVSLRRKDDSTGKRTRENRDPELDLGHHL